MIFEHRHLDEMSDEQIDTLVREHVREHQHLEFKVTVDYREDSQKLELLRDLVSLVNGGGGYLFIGIRDDGKGRAQKYEPDLVGDTEAIKRAIMSLCHSHISDRIEGLEVTARVVKGNPLVIVRVPASARAPHMVTYQDRTDFYTRYHDGKRTMTMSEIREAFDQDIVLRRLSTIEAHLRSTATAQEIQRQREAILQRLKSETVPRLLAIEDGPVLADIALERFAGEIGETPYLWIAATPLNPRVDLISVDSENVRRLVMEAPGSRPNGWNMESPYNPIERFVEGIRRGKKDFEYLEILASGHMEFWTPLDDHFCWRQSEEEFRRRPRLYPYPVTEYPATFLRLYRALVDTAQVKDDFLIHLCYRNLKGYILFPNGPSTLRFEFTHPETKPFDRQHLTARLRRVPNDFEPDRVAYNLLKVVYGSFALEEKAIPFFNREDDRFDFLSS